MCVCPHDDLISTSCFVFFSLSLLFLNYIQSIFFQSQYFRTINSLLFARANFNVIVIIIPDHYEKNQSSKSSYLLKMSSNSREEEAEKVSDLIIRIRANLRRRSMKSEIDRDEGQQDI